MVFCTEILSFDTIKSINFLVAFLYLTQYFKRTSCLLAPFQVTHVLSQASEPHRGGHQLIEAVTKSRVRAQKKGGAEMRKWETEMMGCGG